MTWRLIVLSFFCLLALTSPLLAQEAVQEVMLENGPFQPLTSENWDAAEVVGLIDSQGVSGATWIDNSRIVAYSRQGLWIYTLNQPDKTRFISLNIYIDSIRMTPNHRWMWVMGQDSTIGLFDLEHELYLGAPAGMTLPQEQWSEVWSGHMLVMHPVDNHDYKDGFSNHVEIWDMSGSSPVLVKNIVYPRSVNTPYFVTHALLSADSKTLVTTARAVISQQRIVSLWDLETGTQRIVYEDPLITDKDYPVIALQWADDESSFAVMTPTEALRFAMPTGEPLDSFTYPWCFNEKQELWWIDYQRDELACLTETDIYKRTLDIWQLSNNVLLWTSKGLIPEENFPWVLPDFDESRIPSDWVALYANVIDDNRTTTLVNYKTGQEETFGTLMDVRSLSPDKTHALIWTYGPQWENYAVVDLETDTQTVLSSASTLRDLLFLPNGDLLTLGNAGVVRYSFADRTHTLLPIEAAGMSGMALHPDGRLYVGYDDGMISVYNLETDTLEKRIDNGRPALDLVFTPDGSKMIVASESTIVLRDAEGGFLSQQPAARFAAFNSIPLISADGQWASVNHGLYQIEGQRLKALAPEDVGEDAPDFIRILADYAIYDPYYGRDPDGLQAYRAALPLYLSAPEAIHLVHHPSIFPDTPATVFYPRWGAMSDTMIAVIDKGVIWIYAIPKTEEK